MIPVAAFVTLEGGFALGQGFVAEGLAASRQMTSTASQMTIEQRKQAVGRLQTRLVRSLALYAILLTSAAAIVASIYSPGIDMAPRRLIGMNAVGTAMGGCIFTLVFLLPALRWIGSRAEESRILPIWIFVGVSYGIFTVFLIGASLPFVFALQINILDFRSLGKLLDDLIDAIFRMPLSAFTFGVFALYVGFIAGILYSVGAWVIDMLNRMNYANSYADPWVEAIGDMLPPTKRWASASAPWLSVVGPWAVALLVGGAALLYAATGPVEFLARFRLG